MGRNIEIEILKCTKCGGSFTENPTSISCNECKAKIEISNNKILFKYFEESEISDSLDKLKYFFKKYHKLYSFLINVISPVCPDNYLKKFIDENVNGINKVSINFGSGNSNVSDNVSNVDIFPYDNVDMSCDIDNIPIKDNSVDNIINIAVLEHVTNPEKVVKEFYRILKPGGKIICFFPFMQGFHASPYDYSRRTYEGMKILFKEYNIENLYTAGGPTSGLLWILQDYIAVVLSFGYRPLYSVIYIVLMVITFPVKFLDIILKHNKLAKNCASGFTVVASKKYKTSSIDN
ncbi:MAG: hypothetical protein CR982_05805 [Candidatus Cloacimonadota bacterium]|nr:MAG: hypothetical protein CR982_05805 [Candidatus Cloacimonadota bacterium]PIE81364.1 MAG: hypothetical protein CSA15_00565 [Candidatus Delongbacteria bacterium]